jgi:hypothetical protein
VEAPMCRGAALPTVGGMNDLPRTNEQSTQRPERDLAGYALRRTVVAITRLTPGGSVHEDPSAALMSPQLAAAPGVHAVLVRRDGRPIAIGISVLDDRGWVGLFPLATGR